MPGETPDWGTSGASQGPSVVAVSPIGPLTARTYSAFATLADVTGYAGVWVIAGPSTQDNVAITLGWDITVDGVTFAVASDALQVPKISNLQDPTVTVARWFPAKGQKLSVGVAGNTADTYNGVLLVIPTTLAYPGKSSGVWGDPTNPSNRPAGVVGQVVQNVNAGATLLLPFDVPWWGSVGFSFGVAPPAGSYVQILSFDYTGATISNLITAVSGLPTGPLSMIVPAACYHQIGFHNGSAGVFNPNLYVIGDVS